MMRRTVGCAVVAVLGWAMTASAAETLESVQKKIGEQASKYKTLQYDMRMVSEGMPGEGMPGKMTSDGQFQGMRKGDKTVSRMESKTRMGSGEQAQVVSNVMVMDGEFMYTLTDMGGQKMAMKSKPDTKMGGTNPMDGSQAFKAMGEHFNLKVLPDATVDGKDTWVIEATPKDAKDEQTLTRMVTWYDKKTGIPVKSIGYGKGDKVLNTTVISNVKVNESIPAERFVFKAPPGVEVMDMSKMGGMGGMPGGPQGADDNAPEPAQD